MCGDYAENMQKYEVCLQQNDLYASEMYLYGGLGLAFLAVIFLHRATTPKHHNTTTPKDYNSF